MAEAAYSIGLVVEAPADAKTATTLLDRCLLEKVEWLDAEHLDHHRSWRGIERGTGFTEWKHTKRLAVVNRVTAPGFFDGEPGREDARAARRALLLFAKLGMPDLVMFVRDADDKPERKDGLEQARNGTSASDRIVIGVAVPEREAWVLAGFAPLDDHEHRKLAAERRRLGFDPTQQPHELRGNGKRSAKTALTNLTDNEPEREHRCLVDPPLAELRERGEHTGLAAFIDEIEERIVSVVEGQRSL